MEGHRYPLDELIRAKNQISVLISKVSAEDAHKVLFDRWALKSMIAHFIEWDKASCADIEAFKVGKTPGWVDNIDAFNEQAIKRWKRSTWKRVVKEFNKHSEIMINAYKSLPNGRRFVSMWPNHEMSLAEMLRIDIVHHKDHLSKMIECFRQLGYRLGM